MWATDGAGDYARYRQGLPVEFGSDEWRDQHGLGRGPVRRDDRRQRARQAMQQAMSTKGLQAWDQARADELQAEAEALEAWERDVEQLAHEAADAAPLPTWNARRTAAAVKVRHTPGLDESAIVALLEAGFAWSHRRGGMWWAPRNTATERVAAAVCRP